MKLLRWLGVALLLALPISSVYGQSLGNGSISTAGADCSTATRCFPVDMRFGVISAGLYLDVATSGTFVFEASTDATTLTTGTWAAINDDAGAASATADGFVFFTNKGYTFIRLRASAISGTATLTGARGFAPSSSATVSGAQDTELPAAAALADNTANPTTPGVSAFLMCWDGATWDRCAVTVDPVEDVAETAGVTGPMVLGVRRDVAASSAGTTGDNATFNSDALGLTWTRFLDPCSGVAKTYHIVNMSTATTVEIANAVASQYFYICSVNLVAAAAQTIAIGEDDTDGCGSITAGLHGGATAATGWSFAANGGIALGNGEGTVMKTATAARYLCVITGQAQQISGTIAYVSAP
jgi:hypothetical protein